MWVSIPELWAEVSREVPLSEWEQEQISSKARTRGENDWRWATTDLVEAGWLRRGPSGVGKWAITSVGIQALDEYPGDELFGEAQRRYATIRAQRREEIESQLSTAWLPHDSNQRKVLAAQEIVVDQGLRAGESLFSPGRPIWTNTNVLSLRDLWKGAEKEEGKGFTGSLTVQIADATDDQKLLMAEILATQMLPIAGIGHAKKTERINTVLDLMEHRVEIPRVFDETFAVGAYGPGRSLVISVNLAVMLILEMLCAWTDLDQQAQERLLSESKQWRGFIYCISGTNFPTQRNSLRAGCVSRAPGSVTRNAGIS
ncbi:winged helix-turn-helix domain-containing protein [Nesterenkonia massiliensis]|uniref:Winged helix-turn-helix domain-containing protein n=1 Tax=Nesterenkonia massiliensis TaxID=1232429 RepID=A0ABT2HT12_9MICC|nr:winged helix-turn-helix domain-containing protein [Nesterenkonia massiliensis]